MININASVGNEPLPVLLDQLIPVLLLAEEFKSRACRECGQEGRLSGRFVADYFVQPLQRKEIIPPE